MNIKSQKDFFSGLMFMCVGVAFAWGASTYNIGNGARMGPGYFPLMLGVLLALLGGLITFKALVVETIDGEKIGKFAWKPLFFIITANLVFGACIGGLPSIGHAASGTDCRHFCCLPLSPAMLVKSSTLKAVAILATILAIMSYMAFHRATQTAVSCLASVFATAAGA